MPDFRYNTIDSQIWEQVNNGEYPIDNLNSSDAVIDIGAHIGSFSYYALSKGAGEVFAFEPDKSNYRLAHRNLFIFGNCNLYNLAVVRSDMYVPYVYCSPYTDGGSNTAGTDTIWSNTGYSTLTIPLDNIINSLLTRYNSIRFLKLDCEGSEFPILYTSKLLDKIEEIQMEFHELTGRLASDDVPEIFKYQDYPESFKVEGREPTGRAMASFLLEQGFNVSMSNLQFEGALGKITARR